MSLRKQDWVEILLDHIQNPQAITALDFVLECTNAMTGKALKLSSTRELIDHFLEIPPSMGRRGDIGIFERGEYEIPGIFIDDVIVSMTSEGKIIRTGRLLAIRGFRV